MSGPSREIARFVTEVGLRHRLWAATVAGLGQGLVVAVALCVLDLLAPAWLVWGLLVGLAWVALAWAAAFWRGRMPVERVDAELGLQDRLITWAGLQKDSTSRLSPHAAERWEDPMVAWLEEDLEEHLRCVPQERRRSLWRRPLGALRYLLPVLVLLLVLRWFAPLMPPTHLGDGESSAHGGRGAAAGGRAASPQGGPANRSPSGGVDRPASSNPEGAGRARPKEGVEPPRQAPRRPVSAPKPPLLGLRPRDEFVVPRFVGEGPARRALVRRAVLEDEPESGTGAASAGAAHPPSRGRTRRSSPVVEENRFRKAREAALRARFVGPEEKVFVARYFDVLARQLGEGGASAAREPAEERRK